MKNYQTTAKVVIVISSTSKLDIQKAKEYDRVIHYLIKPLNTQSIEELITAYKSR